MNFTKLSEISSFGDIFSKLTGNWLEYKQGKSLYWEYESDRRIYLTRGLGKNKGKGYLHFDKFVLLDDNNREHTYNITLSSDDKLTIDDFGLTQRQREYDYLVDYDKLPQSVKDFVITHFNNLNIHNKIILSIYLLGGKFNWSVQSILTNNLIRDNIINMLGELNSDIKVIEVAELIRAKYLQDCAS